MASPQTPASAQQITQASRLQHQHPFHQPQRIHGQMQNTQQQGFPSVNISQHQQHRQGPHPFAQLADYGATDTQSHHHRVQRHEAVEPPSTFLQDPEEYMVRQRSIRVRFRPINWSRPARRNRTPSVSPGQPVLPSTPGPSAARDVDISIIAPRQNVLKHPHGPSNIPLLASSASGATLQTLRQGLMRSEGHKQSSPTTQEHKRRILLKRRLELELVALPDADQYSESELDAGEKHGSGGKGTARIKVPYTRPTTEDVQLLLDFATAPAVDFTVMEKAKAERMARSTDTWFKELRKMP